VTIEEHVKRRPEARRTRQRLNREFGRALTYRGAVKKAKLKKLTALAAQVPGYEVPKAAQDAQAL
jgi:hypothetical protein